MVAFTSALQKIHKTHHLSMSRNNLKLEDIIEDIIKLIVPLGFLKMTSPFFSWRLVSLEGPARNVLSCPIYPQNIPSSTIVCTLYPGPVDTLWFYSYYERTKETIPGYVGSSNVQTNETCRDYQLENWSAPLMEHLSNASCRPFIGFSNHIVMFAASLHTSHQDPTHHKETDGAGLQCS